MRVAVFLVCLCFFALRGYDYIYAATQAGNPCYALCQHPVIEKKQTADLASREQPFLKSIPPTGEDSYLIEEEPEDDDINELFVKKYRLLSDYAICLPGIEEHCYNRFKAPQPFSNHLTEKYITQRVLRI